MKKLAFLFWGIFLVTHLPAQPADYKGPAKVYVKSFYRELNHVQANGLGSSSVKNMERAMASVKEKDPAYNTADMEAAIKAWKEKEAQNNLAVIAEDQKKKDKMKAQHDAAWGKINADKLLEYLFRQNHIVGSPNSDELLALINEYKAKTTELMAMDFGERNRSNNSLKMIFATLDSEIPGMANGKGVVKQAKPADNSKMTGDAGVERVKKFFYLIQIDQVKWDAARKLFPQETNYEMMYQKYAAETAKYGSVEDLQKNIEKNNAEETKSRRLPAAVMKNAGAEKMMMEAFDKMYKANYKGSAIKAVILQSDWHSVRNELTSVITGRQRQFAVVYKGTDGKCYLVQSVYLYQEFNGSQYANTIARYASPSGSEILCENVQ